MIKKEYKVIVFENRTEWRNLNGQLDIDGGPAREYTDGFKYWYKEGKRHRENGPAIECVDGYKEYWIDGKQITEAEFNQKNQTCDGKEVIIDGKTYKLELVK